MNNDQVTKFVVEWMVWFYGDDLIPFPIQLQNALTHDQRMEAFIQTEKIKKILKRSR